MFQIFKKKKCYHRFKPIDIMNTKSEPKCVYCKKTLTELKPKL